MLELKNRFKKERTFIWNRSEPFSVKGQMVNILSFANQMVSFPDTQLYCRSTKAAIDTT